MKSNLIHARTRQSRPHTYFASAHPKISPSYIAKMLKGISARMLFIKYPELKEKLYKGHLWNPSYYVETIGSILQESIQKCIEAQSNV